ncbi:hypothetical protein B0H13DRAFT_2669470 [Mycena leptocephala]|nr:hypothetical protein B0H13DRAFT_2669470 [Mycena leptocephala]
MNGTAGGNGAHEANVKYVSELFAHGLSTRNPGDLLFDGPDTPVGGLERYYDRDSSANCSWGCAGSQWKGRGCWHVFSLPPFLLFSVTFYHLVCGARLLLIRHAGLAVHSYAKAFTQRCVGSRLLSFALQCAQSHRPEIDVHDHRLVAGHLTTCHRYPAAIEQHNHLRAGVHHAVTSAMYPWTARNRSIFCVQVLSGHARVRTGQDLQQTS